MLIRMPGSYCGTHPKRMRYASAEGHMKQCTHASICAGERDGRAGGAVAAVDDVQLRTPDVELRAAV